GDRRSVAPKTTLIMMSMINMLLVVTAITICVAYVATWVVRQLMRKLGVMDVPTEGSRKAHGRPVAYEGGLAIWVGIVTGLLTSMLLIPELFLHLREYEGIIIGGTLMVAIGAADDILDMRPVIKLAAQLGV